MFAEPQKEHAWLEQLVGEWMFEGECTQGPDQPNERTAGKQSCRMLGGLWLVGEGTVEMPGGGPAHRSLLTIGFDPAKGRYVGSWIGSMMAMLWSYDGFVDHDGQVLTLEADGPRFDGQGMTSYRDIISLRGKDAYGFHSQVKGEDGAWIAFMNAEYRRA